MSKSYYIVNNSPVFLTFKNYSFVISECEANGILDPHRSMIFADDKEGQKEEYKGICSYLLKIQQDRPDVYDRIKNFSCYEKEARENLYRLLDSFGHYYANRKFAIFPTPVFGFECTSSERYLRCLIENDLCFPMGKRYYFCYSAKDEASGIKVLIDTDKVESLHGNMESFIVFFETGMILKGNYGNIIISYD